MLCLRAPGCLWDSRVFADSRVSATSWAGASHDGARAVGVDGVRERQPRSPIPMDRNAARVNILQAPWGFLALRGRGRGFGR